MFIKTFFPKSSFPPMKILIFNEKKICCGYHYWQELLGYINKSSDHLNINAFIYIVMYMYKIIFYLVQPFLKKKK